MGSLLTACWERIRLCEHHVGVLDASQDVGRHVLNGKRLLTSSRLGLTISLGILHHRLICGIVHGRTCLLVADQLLGYRHLLTCLVALVRVILSQVHYNLTLESSWTRRSLRTYILLCQSSTGESRLLSRWCLHTRGNQDGRLPRLQRRMVRKLVLSRGYQLLLIITAYATHGLLIHCFCCLSANHEVASHLFCALEDSLLRTLGHVGEVKLGLRTQDDAGYLTGLPPVLVAMRAIFWPHVKRTRSTLTTKDSSNGPIGSSDSTATTT